jgi:hypothetical protein
MSASVLAVGTGIAIAAFSVVPHVVESEGGFPNIDGAPGWYLSAPAPTYAASDQILDPRSVIVDAPAAERLSWWGPDGRQPAPQADGERAPDITIANVMPLFGSPSSGSADELQFATTENADLASSLGTSLTTGVQVEMGASIPTLSFPGNGVIVAKRPAVDCSSHGDPYQYTVDAVMLGSNGAKYLVEVDLQFSSRTIARDVTCTVASTAKEAATPAASSAAADAKAVEKDLSGHGTSAAKPDQAANKKDTVGVLAVVLVVATVLTLLVLALLRRAPKSRYDNFGNRIPDDTPDRRDRYRR